MRRIIRTYDLGARGQFRIEAEDKWIYPVATLNNEQGEGVEINFQHTSLEQLQKIGVDLVQLNKYDFDDQSCQETGISID